ncbi:MAG: hypothetical protein E7C03_02105 [Anaerococcus sp.]|nr:hypothetical protein [Anaerococcus sp.]
MRIYVGNYENTYAVGMTEDKIIDSWYYDIEIKLEDLKELDDDLYKKATSVNYLEDIKNVIEAINKKYPDNEYLQFRIEEKEDENFLKLKEKYDGMILEGDGEDFIDFVSQDGIVEYTDNGISGFDPDLQWFTAYSKNGDEFQFYG